MLTARSYQFAGVDPPQIRLVIVFLLLGSSYVFFENFNSCG